MRCGDIGIWDLRLGTWDLDLEIWDPGSETRDLGSRCQCSSELGRRANIVHWILNI